MGMTNPTDPRIEAAARALCQSSGFNPDELSVKLMDCRILEANWKKYSQKAEIAIKAADEAAWLPIESAPLDREIITYYPDGRVMADKFPYRGFLEWREQIYAPPILWQPLPKAPKP